MSDIPDFVLCKVEGCPRTTAAGQVEMCGLAKIYGMSYKPESPLCGSTLTIDAWEAAGLFDKNPDGSWVVP